MFQKSHSGQSFSSSRSIGSPDTVETIVGPSVVVEGDFSSDGNILVKGTVSGNVKTGELLTVERGAKILANVKAKNAVISGEIKGNVRVMERLELHETSRVTGDIACSVLVVDAGALVHGKVNMKGALEAGEEKNETAKASLRGKKKTFAVARSKTAEQSGSDTDAAAEENEDHGASV